MSYTGKSSIVAPPNVFGQLLVPDVDQARRSYLRYQAVFTILRVEVALYQYRVEEGHFSQTLDALVPAYLPALPDDPFGGARNTPIRYKPTPDGNDFVLYSIGPNMADDNGKPETWPSAASATDIVSGYLFPK